MCFHRHGLQPVFFAHTPATHFRTFPNKTLHARPCALCCTLCTVQDIALRYSTLLRCGVVQTLPLAAQISCTFSTTSFSSVQFSVLLPRLRLMLVGIWLGLCWVLFYFFDHYIQSSVHGLVPRRVVITTRESDVSHFNLMYSYHFRHFKLRRDLHLHLRSTSVGKASPLPSLYE